MMFGFGWLMMLLVIGFPLLLVVVLLVGLAGYLQNRTNNIPATMNQTSTYRQATSSSLLVAPAARYCSHCGAGLQSDWTHCPQCGAPIQ